MFSFKMELSDEPFVTVHTTENRGFTPEEVAERCAAKIISVSDSAHPGIRDQARAFQKHIEKVVAHYMREVFGVTELRYIIT